MLTDLLFGAVLYKGSHVPSYCAAINQWIRRRGCHGSHDLTWTSGPDRSRHQSLSHAVPLAVSLVLLLCLLLSICVFFTPSLQCSSSLISTARQRERERGEGDLISESCCCNDWPESAEQRHVSSSKRTEKQNLCPLLPLMGSSRSDIFDHILRNLSRVFCRPPKQNGSERDFFFKFFFTKGQRNRPYEKLLTVCFVKHHLTKTLVSRKLCCY